MMWYKLKYSSSNRDAIAPTCSSLPAINTAGWSAHRRPRLRRGRTGTYVRLGSKHCRTERLKTQFWPYWDAFSARFGAVSGVLLGLAPIGQACRPWPAVTSRQISLRQRARPPRERSGSTISRGCRPLVAQNTIEVNQAAWMSSSQFCTSQQVAEEIATA
jgi:hypothetical protein